MGDAVERRYQVMPTLGGVDGGATEFVGVSDVALGVQGELILTAGDGGLVALFAPGQWAWAEVVAEDDVAAAEAEAG